MARIARLLCVLGVLSVSSSAFADMLVSVVDNDPLNDNMDTNTQLLTDGRLNDDPVFGGGILAITASIDTVDYFRVNLLQNDELMVDTYAPTNAITVTLYDNSGSAPVEISGSSIGPGIRFTNTGIAATYYIGVTGLGTNTFMTTFGVRNHTPEPATMSFLAIGAIALIRRRRRR